MAPSHYDAVVPTRQKMQEFIALLAQLNAELLNPRGLNLLHPRNNAWLFLEMEYY